MQPAVQFGFPTPPVERRCGLLVVGRQHFVLTDRARQIAGPVQHLAEQRARATQFRVERECVLERLTRVGVAAFEHRGRARADVQLRVPGIARDRLTKGIRGVVCAAGGQSVPAGALEQRSLGIGLGRGY